MSYELKELPCRPWLLQGLSPRLIESHYENNYGGALRRLNAITAQLGSSDPGKLPGFALNGLKREELVALNSVVLHELYFASLGGDGRDMRPLADVLARDFGSPEAWKGEFVAMGKSLGGGSGWVVLTWLPRERRLVNQFAADHTQALASGVPILAMDMYEHAYHMDFGANAAAYVETFMRNIDWNATSERYQDAARVEPMRPFVQKEFGDLPAVGVEEVRSMLASGQRIQFIDARPKHYVARTQEIIDGATWRDPERVKEWAGELSKDDPVVVYCVYGFHIGCQTAGVLREAGFDAKYMKGGHVAWKALGGPVKMNG